MASRLNLQKLRLYRNPVYPKNIARFAIQLRYTSFRPYKLMPAEFPMPSISHLRNLTYGECCHLHFQCCPLHFQN